MLGGNYMEDTNLKFGLNDLVSRTGALDVSTRRVIKICTARESYKLQFIRGAKLATYWSWGNAHDHYRIVMPGHIPAEQYTKWKELHGQRYGAKISGW